MKHISFLVLLFIMSCHAPSQLINENGKLVIRKQMTGQDSSFITGSMFELQTSEKLKLSDIWIEHRRFACDTAGSFRIGMSPGTYEIQARSFGFNNFKHTLVIRKGEVTNLLYYLVPFKSEGRSNNIH